MLDSLTAHNRVSLCPIYYKIYGRHYCLYKYFDGSLSTFFYYHVQRCFSLFIVINKLAFFLHHAMHDSPGNLKHSFPIYFYQPKGRDATSHTVSISLNIRTSNLNAFSHKRVQHQVPRLHSSNLSMGDINKPHRNHS